MPSHHIAETAAPAPEWRRIENHPNYAISSDGLVASYKRTPPRLLKPSAGTVYLDGVRHSVAALLHRAFPPHDQVIPALESLPPL